jgi:DNA modification methylase
MIDFKNMDCIEYLYTLEDNSIDLVIIDPPYNISKSTNFASGDVTNSNKDRFRVSYDFGEWDHKVIDILHIFKIMYSKMKHSSTIITFYDLWKISHIKHYYEMCKFKKIRFAEWIKTNPVPINAKSTYLSNAREVMVIANKGKGVFNNYYHNGVYSYGICRDKGRFHPTQKPLNLIKELIVNHSNEGDVVLDCFAGSGVTAVACKELKRNFKGCEKDSKYYELANTRIENFVPY